VTVPALPGVEPAEGWAGLAGQVRGCTRCAELAATRRTVVVGEAPPGARIALLGEAPGAQEDESGRPFVGRAGQLLDACLDEAGLHRDQVAVLNTLKCRPPGNRRPTATELGHCRPWLDAQLALVRPVVLVALGTTAATAVLGRLRTLAAAREQVHEVQGRQVLATYHPSAALRWGPAGAPRAALVADLARARALAG